MLRRCKGWCGHGADNRHKAWRCFLGRGYMKSCSPIACTTDRWTRRICAQLAGGCWCGNQAVHVTSCDSNAGGKIAHKIQPGTFSLANS